MPEDPEVLDLLNRGTGPHRTVLVRTGFDEWMIPDLTYDREPKWYGGYVLGHVWPAHRHAAERLVHLLIDRDVDTVEYGFNDLHMNAGNEHELRAFVRAFVALPRKRFTKVTGKGLDPNVCLKTARAKGEQYLLIINPGWWTTDATLTLDQGVPLADAVTGKRVGSDAEGRITLSLGAYGISCLKAKGRWHVESCDAKPDREGLEVATARSAECRRLLKTRELETKVRAATSEALDRVQAALDRDDLVTAWETLVSWPVHRALYR